MLKETADQIVGEVFSANPGIRQIAPGRSVYEFERAFETPRNLLLSLPEPVAWLAPVNPRAKDNHGAVWAEAHILTSGLLSTLGMWLLDQAIDEDDPVTATVESRALAQARVLSVVDARGADGNQRTWTFDLGSAKLKVVSGLARYDSFALDRANAFAEKVAIEMGWFEGGAPGS